MTIDRRRVVAAVVQKAFPEYPVFFGFDDIPELKRAMSSGPYVFVDHAYFGRGYERGNFRVILSGLHQTKLKPVGKAKTFVYKPKDWRKGSHILVFPPSLSFVRTLDGKTWTEDVCAAIREHSDRRVVVKLKNAPHPLSHYLHGCHAVVGYGTVASVEAVMAGIPAFAGPWCPATPVGLADLSQIESPRYGDREPWFNSLTWSQFSLNEIRSGLCRETLLG